MRGAQAEQVRGPAARLAGSLEVERSGDEQSLDRDATRVQGFLAPVEPQVGEELRTHRVHRRAVRSAREAGNLAFLHGSDDARLDLRRFERAVARPGILTHFRDPPATFSWGAVYRELADSQKS